MTRLNRMILTSVLVIAPIMFSGCKENENVDNARNTGNTSTDSTTDKSDVAKQQNVIDPNDKNVPDGVKDKYIRDREVVGSGKK